ncbi:TRAP transporter small permease [Salinicola corii]|uniref:TRAP transporter small permease protein n=1 Tax=Salinicola corii TaxID=2606937 RepID=A0A640WH44_9GAMM|nr:TRAP transporter small permease [Salinicola corii]KAA0019638.1 TRAP transporter small permease [Salinicola corii]
MNKILENLFLAISGTLLTLMVVVVFYGVVSRELGWSVAWTTELGQMLFLASVFTGAAYATLKKAHLQIGVLSGLVKGRFSQPLLEGGQQLVVILFSAAVAWFATANLMDGFRYPDISPTLGINRSYLYAIMAASFTVIAIHGLYRLGHIVVARGRIQ